LVAKNYVNHYSNSVVEQLHPLIPLGNFEHQSNEFSSKSPIVLLTLVRHLGQRFIENSTLAVYHLPDLDVPLTPSYLMSLEGSNLVFEFDSVYFCCDTYLNDCLVLGGDSKCSLFKLSNNENRSINVAPDHEFKLKSEGIVRSMKFSNDGKTIYCGTDRGKLHLVNLSNDSYDSQLYNPQCGPIVDLKLLDEHQLIISSHNHNLFKIDLRYFDESKPLKTQFKFEGHRNVCEKIKFSIDDQFQTLTSCGDDNCVRLWSIRTGELIRVIDFKDTCDRIVQKDYSDDFLLDQNYTQLFRRSEGNIPNILPRQVAQQNETISSSSSNQLRRISSQQSTVGSCLNYYNGSNRAQYQIVTSSNWNCLKDEPRSLMIGSISDSLDLFY